MIAMTNLDRFVNMTFEDFRILASEKNLSKYERIGFPDSYRKHAEHLIFEDICKKLDVLGGSEAEIADIGPGCSDLPRMLIEMCRAKKHRLTLMDSQEMLDHIPDEIFIEKCVTRFPECEDWISVNQSRFNCIICYSVLHYIHREGSVYDFLDAALSLLAPGGQLLIGDIPNSSQRKRFFSSEAGIAYHKEFMNTDEPPLVKFNQIERYSIDDTILFSLVLRARAQGFNAYIVPQPPNLPMSNRREDILIFRP